MLAAGDLDLSFGVGGKVAPSFPAGSSWTAMNLAVQNDGRIVVAGYFDNGGGGGGQHDFAVARYNSDGNLDTSFDGDGKLTTDFGSDDFANSVTIQTDGKIVVGGNSGSRTALARYNSDGSLDTTFDGDGKLTTPGGGGAIGIVLEADGKIVVAGRTYNGSNSDFALTRYDTDGTLDTTFDGDGKVSIDFSSSDDVARSVQLQSDGKIVVAGYIEQISGPNFAIARYNADGSLDTSFDEDGKLTTDLGVVSFDIANSVFLQLDGKIVVAGYTNITGNADFALARYDTDGSLDTSFDGDGKQTTDFGTVDDFAYSVVLQTDGKIVVAGMTNGNNYDFALARYNSDGTLDMSFDADGKVKTDFGTGGDNITGMALQSDGKIVVVGNIGGGTHGFALARYDSSGPPTFTSANIVSLPENTTAVGTVTATDADLPAQTITFSITGGVDHALFAITSDGVLAFTAAPDFEAPTDTNTDNVYLVQITANDGNGGTTLQELTVTITAVNDNNPVFTSGATPRVAENTTAVTMVTATDADLPAQTVTFSITGGADAAKFSITSGGILTFVAAPNFEIPTDVGGDNVYDVQVTATDNGTGNLAAVQMIAVTVTDVAPVNEAPVITGPPSVNSSQRPVISWTAVTGATEYEIWVTKNPSTSQYHAVTVTQTSYTPPVDFGIGKFNLWVRAKNSETSGPWTPKYPFVINTPVTPQAISRLQPTLRPTISWNALPGAVKYDVWINDVSRGINPHIRNIEVSGTSFTPAADLPLGLYRAWVRGIAVDGTAGSWSTVIEFVTMQAPTITQGQNSTFDRAPTFAWNALPGAAKYEVFIRNRNTGATTVDERNITGLSFTPTSPLADGPYRWWAIGVSAQGVRSHWTAPMDIYIGGRTDLLSPAGSSNQATPTFAWRPVDGAVRYDLWVNQVGGQAQIIRQQNLTGTNYTPLTSLPTGSYRAWIRAVSSTGEVSPWSLEAAFTITAIAPRGNTDSPDGMPDVLLFVLTDELSVTNRGLNTTRSSRRIIDTEEIQPEERMPRIDGPDWASMPTDDDVRPEQLADDLLVVAIHEFLGDTYL